VYRGGTWLSPLHRMVPLPRSFAADAHGCIMVAGRHGPTEYKVVARRSALVARLRSDHLVKKVWSRRWRVDWECSASRLALARARFAAYGLDPSAFPVRVARHRVGARRRRSVKARKGSVRRRYA